MIDELNRELDYQAYKCFAHDIIAVELIIFIKYVWHSWVCVYLKNGNRPDLKFHSTVLMDRMYLFLASRYKPNIMFML